MNKVTTIKVNGHKVAVRKGWNDFWCENTWSYYSERDGRWIQISSKTKVVLICALEYAPEFEA